MPRSWPSLRWDAVFLTGSYREAAFAADDYRSANPRFQPENFRQNLAIVDVVESVASRHRATAAQVALAWVLAQGDHVIAIPGTRRRTRLSENVAAAGLQLPAADLAELNALPQPAGSRY